MKKHLLILALIWITILGWCIQKKIDSDIKYYTNNDYYNMVSSWTLHIINNFKTYQQTEEYSCACALSQSVLNYYWMTWYTEKSICELANTSVLSWTVPDWLIKFYEDLWLISDYHTWYNNRFNEPDEFEDYIIDAIDNWEFVLVNWVDYGWHWQGIIWIDTMSEDVYDDVLIMADTADETDHNQDWYYIVPLWRFFYMWEEASCTETKYKQPFIRVHN
jgi:hypothetical protein